MCCFFFLNDAAPTEIYPLSLPAALPIFVHRPVDRRHRRTADQRDDGGEQRGADGEQQDAGDRLQGRRRARPSAAALDRKSTRLNSSHGYISYAGFCLKKKTSRCVQPPLA